MISLERFRNKVYSFFHLIEDVPVFIDVKHKGKGYRVHIEPLGKQAKISQTKKPLPIEEARCDCGGLMLNGVCMSLNHKTIVR